MSRTCKYFEVCLVRERCADLVANSFFKSFLITAVFAPTNDAFAHLQEGALDFLLQDANKETLTKILQYHVAAEEVFSEALTDGQSIETLADGETVSVQFRRKWSWRDWGWSTETFINDAKVTTLDVEASNGVIHVIDRVLIPSSVSIPMDIVDTAISNGLVALVAALKLTGLDKALRGEGTFTVFAPTNDAFTKLDVNVIAYLMRNPEVLKQVLLYHVVEGEKILSTDVPENYATLNGESLNFPSGTDDAVSVLSTDSPSSTSATVVTPDIDVLNGVVHVIDTVLIPPGLEIPAEILTLALDTEDLSTLVSAVESAGLVDALNLPGPFTVLAPTNKAFAALEEVPTGDDLIKVLLYHVIPGQVTAADIIEAGSMKKITLSGQFVDFSASDDGQSVFVNDSAMVTVADIFALNGVVHVIDEVLIPPPVTCHLPQWLCNLFGN